jgi:hypothetical protein
MAAISHRYDLMKNYDCFVVSGCIQCIDFAGTPKGRHQIPLPWFAKCNIAVLLRIMYIMLNVRYKCEAEEPWLASAVASHTA